MYDVCFAKTPLQLSYDALCPVQKIQKLYVRFKKIEDRSHEMLDKWREKSNEFVRNFIEMYGTMNQYKDQIIEAISPGRVSPNEPDANPSEMEASPNECLRPRSPSFLVKNSARFLAGKESSDEDFN